MSLIERILRHIDDEGGISTADYMEMVLSDPEEGYYTTRMPLGLEGDFVTAPEISQIFGELVGIWLAECWQMLGSPKADLVELGPGLGTLMVDVLRATKHVPGFHDAIDVRMIETSPRLRRYQQSALAEKHPRITWHSRLPEGDRPLLVVGNEFFDALPVYQYVVSSKGFRERIIVRAEDKETLAFDLADAVARKLPFAYPRIHASEVTEGDIVEICPLAQEITAQLAGQIAMRGGAGLFIDYGYTRPEDGTHAVGDTLQAVKKHKYHDPLADPGMADLTAHVDFSVLAQVAVAQGGYAPPVLSQREFLLRMGGELRMRQLCSNTRDEQTCDMLEKGFQRLVDPEEMGELFKVLAIMPAGVPAPIFTQPAEENTINRQEEA